MSRAAHLLAGAEAALGRLDPQDRTAPKLIAKAIATARREIEAANEIARAEAALPSGSIRGGALDGDENAHAVLLRLAALRAWVANPKALTDAELAMIGRAP